MKKTTQVLMAFLFLSLGVATEASAKIIECKAQLARGLEAQTEVLPAGREMAILEISENGAASTSLTFTLKGETDLAYRLDLAAQTKTSGWSSQALAFTLDVKIWDLKNNKLVGLKTLNSDNVRSRFLLNKLTEEDTALIIADIPSFETRGQLLSSESVEVASLAQVGRWTEAVNAALSRALIHPLTADFASVNCSLKN